MFDGFDPHADEAGRRWGHTDEYAESIRRTRGYDAAAWERIRAEADDMASRFADLMRTGAAADGGEAVALAADHRAHIDRWFYACSPEVHRGLGDLYVADERFAKGWEAVEPGLADFVRLAFAAEAAAAIGGRLLETRDSGHIAGGG